MKLFRDVWGWVDAILATTSGRCASSACPVSNDLRTPIQDDTLFSLYWLYSFIKIFIKQMFFS